MHGTSESFAVSSQRKDLQLNGKPLKTPMFLAAGDTLHFSPYQISFLTGEKNEKHSQCYLNRYAF